jgi:PAS domain-containing protein
MFIAAVVPLTALLGYGLWSQYRSDEAAVAQQAVDEARVLAGQLDDHIGNLENLLAGLSAAVSFHPADVDENDALLWQVSTGQPDFVAHINLFTTDGTNIGTSGDPTGPRPRPVTRKYFQQVLAGQRLSIGDVFNGQGTGRWVVHVAYPVQDKLGQLRGVLAVGTWLDQLPDTLRMQALPPNSVVTIIDDAGIVVSRSVDANDWIGRNTNKWKNHDLFAGSDRGAVLLEWGLPDHTQRVTTFATAHRVPWRVVVGIPTNEAFASVVKRLGWSGLFIAVTLLVGFAIAWYLSGRLVRPLRQLGKDASRLASGELSHRSTVKSRDEIGTLADDFNRMATALERRAEEARTAADEVRQTKDTLAAVIDSSPVAIVCCDVNRTIVLWNRTAEKMFGYTAEESLGRPTKLVPSDSSAV